MLIPATRSRLVGLCSCLFALICVLPSFGHHLCLFRLVWALWGFDGSLRALRPLVYVYIKYTVSTYMIIEKLTLFLKWNGVGVRVMVRSEDVHAADGAIFGCITA